MMSIKRIIGLTHHIEAALLETEQHLDWLTSYIDSIDERLSKLFPQDSETSLEKAAADALSKGGKRVRAILALLTCEIYSGDYKPAVPLAVAYELAHASALVQDDIIDSSNMRRGAASIVSKYGLSNAILTSDLLLFNVPKIMSTYGEVLDNLRLAKLFDLLGEACRGAVWGEYLDLEMSKKTSEIVSEIEYEEMIRSKTASMLAAPSASGAIIGGASDEETKLAYRFGERLGMAYQVHDDTLDLFGDEQTLGKPIFTDMHAGKKNLVLIHCLNHCTQTEREFLDSLFIKKGEYSDEEISNAREILVEHGSLQFAKSRSVHYINQAINLIEKFPSKSRAKESLMILSQYLSERYY
jgi:geranylgeranyl pyrophosphate synthase